MYKLSGDGGVIFTNALFWPVTVSLNVPKSVVTKYQVGDGFPSQAPKKWSVAFYDAENLAIGVDTRSGESFSLGEVREFPISPAALVSKAVQAITKVPLVLIRDSVATRASDLGLIELVPANTPIYTYDPVTLAPFGLLIVAITENLIDTGDISLWLEIY